MPGPPELGRWGNRSWSFVKIEASGSIDFSQVLQANFGRTRKSLDNTEFMVKWDGFFPSTIGNLRDSGSLGLYIVPANPASPVQSGSGQHQFNHEQVLRILKTPRWIGEPEPSGSLE